MKKSIISPFIVTLVVCSFSAYLHGAEEPSLLSGYTVTIENKDNNIFLSACSIKGLLTIDAQITQSGTEMIYRYHQIVNPLLSDHMTSRIENGKLIDIDKIREERTVVLAEREGFKWTHTHGFLDHAEKIFHYLYKKLKDLNQT